MTDKTNHSQQKTLGQRRAADAWERVKHVEARKTTGENGKKFAKEYGSLVRGLPAMIQSQGLAPALSFLKAKGKEHHNTAYEQVSSWVMHELSGKREDLENKADKYPVKSDLGLLEWILHQDSIQYRRATTIALAYLNYLKRFAEAKKLGEDDKKKDEDTK